VGSDVEVIVHAVLFPLRALRVLRGEIACAEIVLRLTPESEVSRSERSRRRILSAAIMLSVQRSEAYGIGEVVPRINPTIEIIDLREP